MLRKIKHSCINILYMLLLVVTGQAYPVHSVHLPFVFHSA